MGLRDEIEALVARDNKTTTHHLDLHRVEEDELHPARVDHERASKSRSAYGARAVVESFHARLEERPMRGLDTEPAQRSDSSPPNTQAPGLWQEEGITIHKCAYDARGIVEVVCSSEDFRYDLPIFIVNPPLLVEDENGEIEELDEEGNVIARYTQDPTQAMFDILADLKDESAQNPSKTEGDA